MTSPGSVSTWRRYTDQIMYGTDLRQRATDALIERLADEILRHRFFDDPVENYYQAAVKALASGENVTVDDRQNQDAARDLLNRMLRALDARKPWPVRPFQNVDPGEWPSFRGAPVVGYVPLTESDAAGRIHRYFSERPTGGDLRLLLLILRSGQRVALCARPPFNDPGLELLSHDDPQQTIRDFQELTGLPVEAAPQR